jgi:GNAT superfamily N-acetyltransferase
VEIREARPEEYAAVGELAVRCYLDAGFVPADSPYLPELADAARRASEAELLVAVDGGQLLGSVTFAPPGSPYGEGVAGPADAAFRMLVVSPAARRRGVGRALVLSCLDRARALGCERMRLSSQPAMSAAHRLYEQLGFARTPHRDWAPRPDVPLITYALDLPPVGPATTR